ncbi:MULTISPECIES: membrane-bound lytic murein transglycosylase MltF [unclassified Halomonas]|uniref:membrane-bound lytic murein transglycosylase MltF n=1 Tax=unclassified Halomonas TaxID=2609666 RepID=UPI0021AB4E47|nr:MULTISPECIES: membrane-bound lytic murein transglycosylase MltF [unclassified Halomonas]
MSDFAPMKDGFRHARRLRILAASGLGLLCALWPTPPGPSSSAALERVLARDFITVHTRNTPFTYYEGRQGPTGFEYELMRRFADRLGVSLNLSDDHHVQSVLDAVRHQGDLGAAALPLDPLAEGLVFSRPILSMQPMVVYRRGLQPPKALDDLKDWNIGIAKGTGISRVMHELQREHPRLSWKEAEDLEIASLLRRIEDGELDAAVVYAHQFRLNRLFFPEVEDGFDIGEPVTMAWAFSGKDGLALIERANTFFDELRADGELDRLTARYFGHDDYLEYVGARVFINHVNKRLPRFDALFREAARAQHFDWKLLAAVGYQESHWDPEATSPTGVRGLMMLTNATAEEVGVSNRLDPAQSIEGGARYLRSVEQRLPESITGEDRLYMALAAYNVGLGHLYDARDIARMRGGNPDLWRDVREALPLLQESQWHSKTRHGYARGGEPVIYVQNIRRYLEILDYVDRSQQQFHQLNARLPDQADAEIFELVPPMP